MDIKVVHPYKKGVEEFYKFFADPKTVQTKCEGLGHRNVQNIEAKDEGNAFTIKTNREIPASVPAILQKFLGAWNKVIETDVWTKGEGGVRKCEMDVNLVGVPVKVKGIMTVIPKGSGCENHCDFKATCGIPLIGGKLADFVGGLVKKSMDEEFQYITKAMG